MNMWVVVAISLAILIALGLSVRALTLWFDKALKKEGDPDD